MSKVRIPINPMQVGRVGAYSMYVRKGEQIVRQRRNSSNYGESAMRSYAQQERRARWGNLVSCFKAMKSWQPKAWESAAGGRTDYNEFMSANANTTPVYLTKDMIANGCAVMDAFVVSKGSLAPIDGEWSTPDNAFTTNIVLSITPGASTTIGALSRNIIDNNGNFINGDNIAYICFLQQLDSRGYPYLRSVYTELTLDTASEALLSSTAFGALVRDVATQNLYLGAPSVEGWTFTAAVAIHTRRSSSLLVSTQRVSVADAEFVGAFTDEASKQAAIDSYGVSSAVPLEPGEGGGSEDTRLTSFVTTISGNGSESVYSQIYNLKPGTYRVVATPNRWDIGELSGDTWVLTVQGRATASAGSVNLQGIPASNFDEGGVIAPFEIAISEQHQFVDIVLRAAVGTDVSVSMRRVS